MKKNEKGFSAVEVLIVIVVVGLIGGAGWYVWQSRDKSKEGSKSETRDTGQQESKEQTAERTDETADWKEVTSGQKGFKVKVPDGWNVHNWTSRDYLYAGSYKDVTHTAGKMATVTTGDTYAIDSGPVRHFNITGNPIAQKATIGNYYGETPQDFGPVSGVMGKKYVHTYNEDVDGIKKGDKIYQYRFEGAKTLITVEYYVLNGETDQSVLVEQAVRTLSFE